MSDTLNAAIEKAEAAKASLASLGSTPTVIPIPPEVTKTLEDALAKHQADFNPDAWKDYTAEELYWWTHLLLKRAIHRKPGDKRAKDVYDAENYFEMYKLALKAVSPDTDVEKHSNYVHLAFKLNELKAL